MFLPIVLVVIVVVALAFVFVEPLRTDFLDALDSLSAQTASGPRPEPPAPSREEVRERADFLFSQTELMKWGLLSCPSGQRMAFNTGKELERKYPNVRNLEIQAVGRL